ncbi:MAG: hypothetical protein ACI9R3_005134 [Verrucomicrobiales bacterium]|jgi:hypothetical protein
MGKTIEDLSGVRRVVGRVSSRQNARRFLERFAVASLAWAACFLVFVLVARLSALIPDVFDLATILIVPALGLLTALLLHRSASAEESARLVDQSEGSHDLFLTALRLPQGAGDFMPIVRQQAAAAAQNVQPSRVVPLRWNARFGYLMFALAGLTLVIGFTPQFDPFQRRELAQQEDERVRKLEDSLQATVLQSQALEDRNLEDRSQAIEREFAKLDESFRAARPELKEQTNRELSERQAELGKFWRQLSDEKLRDALSKSKAGQKFGAQSPMRKQFRKLAENGKFSDIQKAMEGIKQKLNELAGEPDSAERRKEMDALKEKMQAMADALSEALGSDSLDKAMSRALEQMDMSNMQDLAQKAMEAMQESMDLSQEELENLAQALSEMENLQEALSAAQLAKALNEMGELSGEGQGEGKGMSDYEKIYRERLAQAMGEGEGQGGMEDRGNGKGGVAPEDPSARTAFKTEKSKSALQKGKLLMNVKSKGNAEPGEVDEAYRSAVGELREAASEAILQEQIPPGYHDSIRDYFDQLDPLESVSEN